MDSLIDHLVDSLSSDFGHGNSTTVEVCLDFVALEIYRAGSVTKILNNFSMMCVLMCIWVVLYVYIEYKVMRII